MARLTMLAPRHQRLRPRHAMQVHAGPERDRVRNATKPWRAWYKTKAWREKRLEIFNRDLFTCQMEGCGHIEADTSLLTCDHKKPHRGDESLFWDDQNLQTLCKPCHDRLKQAEERRGGW